jgi:hypothetical protein
MINQYLKRTDVPAHPRRRSTTSSLAWTRNATGSNATTTTSPQKSRRTSTTDS